MFRILLLSFSLLLFSFVSVFAFDVQEVLGPRDDVVDLEEEQVEAYDWLVENVENEEIFLFAVDRWGDDYHMVKFVYLKQTEAYEWLKGEGVLEEVVEKYGDEYPGNYDVMMFGYNRDQSASSFSPYLFALYPFMILNVLFALFFVKDMLSRGCNVFKWFLAIVFLGPLGLVLYLVYKDLKKDEQRNESNLYYFSRYFLIWWNLYFVSSLFVVLLFFFVVGLLEGVSLDDSNYFFELVFWIVAIFGVVIIPFFTIPPSIVAFFVMILTKKR